MMKKERPWENPDSPYHHAMELNKASEDGGYIHPVEVVWNEKEYRYITVLPEYEKKEFADIDNPEFCMRILEIRIRTPCKRY